MPEGEDQPTTEQQMIKRLFDEANPEKAFPAPPDPEEVKRARERVVIQDEDPEGFQRELQSGTSQEKPADQVTTAVSGPTDTASMLDQINSKLDRLPQDIADAFGVEI